MKNKNLISRVAIFAFMAVFALTASARQLLYYYDFDTVDANGNISSIENKGTGAAEPSFKKVVSDSDWTLIDSDFLFKTDGGPFDGSGCSFYSGGASRSIWLPSGEGDLGCGTTNGFTLSMWMKYGPDRSNWTDFFGFVVGPCRYFCEHTGNVGEFALYGAITGVLSVTRLATIKAPENSWAHFAIVFTPASRDQFCSIDLYINGNLATNINACAEGPGILKQVHIGATTKDAGNVRYKGTSRTSVDEFAIFDYPATAEQIKWLAKHKPGQPVGGPGREMPLCWRFEQTVNNQVESRTVNSGTGNIETRHIRKLNTDAPYTMRPGALSTYNAYSTSWNMFTFGAIDDDNGLGATAGSGFSFSFWLYAGSATYAWADFFGFVLGPNNAIHLEWTNRGSPTCFAAYGASSPSPPDVPGRVVDAWQHIALAYDIANTSVDIYINGAKKLTATLETPVSDMDLIKRITVGPNSYYYENGSLVERALHHVDKPIAVDEFAFFNYSISPEEIAWLGSNIPRLPPLTATNLARTVSADCTWAGGLASWNVLDGEGADTGQRSIYPSCEDTEVEVSVSIAADATIVNDTYVTPAKLRFANAVVGDVASATLVSAQGSMLAPETMELGEGVRLIVSPGEVSVTETLRFAQGSKIVFDMSNAGEEMVVKGLSAGSFALPSDDDDLISHFAVRGGAYDIVISEDGKSIYIKKRPGFRIIIR